MNIDSHGSSEPESSRRCSRASSMVMNSVIFRLLLQVNRLCPVNAVSAILPVAPLASEHLPFVVILAHARLTLGVVNDGDVGRAVVSQDVAPLGHHFLRPVTAPQGNREAL